MFLVLSDFGNKQKSASCCIKTQAWDITFEKVFMLGVTDMMSITWWINIIFWDDALVKQL